MGKNTLYMIFAQILFIASGYGIHVGIGRILGPERYGEFGVILSLLAVLEIFLVSGLCDSVTKFTAEYPERSSAIRKQGLKIEAIAGCLVFLFVFLASQPIAAAFHNVHLSQPLRLSAFLVPLIALYSVYLGSLGGQGMFGKRAIAMSVQSLSKVGGVFVFILLGFGIQGAVGGYVLAYGLALLTAFLFTRKGPPESPTFSSARLISFAVPLIFFSGAVSLLMNLDMIFVKSLIQESPSAGFYTAAVALTRAPFQIFSAFAITMLPAISRSTASRNLSQGSGYILKSVKAILVLLAPVAFFVAGSSGEIIRLIYSSKYLAAARPLGVLVFGITFLSLFSLLAAVITGSGRPRIPMAVACSLVPLDLVLNVLLIPRFGLEGAAAATTLTCLTGLVIHALYVKRKFGVLVSFSAFSKILLCSCLLYLVPRVWLIRGWGFIPYALALFTLYFLFLTLLKVIGKEEFYLVRGLCQNLVKTNP
jgi:stage V sporulation protein B